MPDWIIHIGVAKAVTRPWRGLDPRWLALGAVLPDAIPRALWLGLMLAPPGETAWSVSFSMHVGFLHTPVSVLLLIAAAAAVARDRGAAWRGLLIGAALHFGLDLMQRSWGGGTAMLYPIRLEATDWLHLAFYDGWWSKLGVAVCAIYLLQWGWRSARRRDAILALSPARLAAAGCALAACLLLPLTAVDRAIAQNVGGCQFAVDPASFEGMPVQLAVVHVAAVRADEVEVELYEHRIPVDWRGRPEVRPDAFVSVRGRYRDGRVWPDEVFVHDYDFKILASMGGALLLLWLWWPGLCASVRRRRPAETP